MITALQPATLLLYLHPHVPHRHVCMQEVRSFSTPPMPHCSVVLCMAGSFPRGLSLMLRAMSAWIYDRDPFQPLRWTRDLQHFKARAGRMHGASIGISNESFAPRDLMNDFPATCLGARAADVPGAGCCRSGWRLGRTSSARSSATSCSTMGTGVKAAWDSGACMPALSGTPPLALLLPVSSSRGGWYSCYLLSLTVGWG